MKTLEFLSELNAAPQGWGFWIDRQHIEENHVGQYSFENDRLPKSFVHIGSLAELAHQRQKYILSHLDNNANTEELGQEWAQTLLANIIT
jgi:hypothetical protein